MMTVISAMSEVIITGAFARKKADSRLSRISWIRASRAKRASWIFVSRASRWASMDGGSIKFPRLLASYDHLLKLVRCVHSPLSRQFRARDSALAAEVSLIATERSTVQTRRHNRGLVLFVIG
jgi:hypothetical protein